MSARRFTDEEARELARLNKEGMGLSQLARRHGTNHSTIRNTLRRIGITEPYRGWHDTKKKPVAPEELETMVSLYKEGKPQEYIAEVLGTSQTRVSRTLIAVGERRAGERPLRTSGTWTNAEGYVFERIAPDDPMTTMANNGYVLQHRLVLARYLGRPLTPKETVHHINGRRGDNRIENLQLRNGKHGKGVALCCADCGSRNIVEITFD